MGRSVDDPLLALLPKTRRRLAQTDPVMARILREHPPQARSIQPKSPFAALVESITHQQVSLAAGRTIYARVEAACGAPLTAEAMLRTGAEGLRAAGLSGSKVAYTLDLAQRTVSGEVDFARFAEMSDDEVVATLTRVKGIGVWTAKMFLLFHLNRPDVLAPEDLGLQIAVANAYGVPRAKAAEQMRRMHPKWSPYSSVVALALWNWRRLLLEEEQAQARRLAAASASPRAKRK